MSDTKSDDDKTLSVGSKETLTVKRTGIEQGTVRQNFLARPLEGCRRRNEEAEVHASGRRSPRRRR